MGVEFVSVSTVLLDLIVAVKQCVDRLLEKGAFKGSWCCDRATAQALLFISLPICLAASVIASTLDAAFDLNIQLEQILGFLVPSVITLILMWDRHYIGGSSQYELELDWVSSNSALKSEFARNSLHSTRQISLFGGASSADTEEGMSVNAGTETFFTPPLRSYFSFPLVIAGTGGALLTIREDLAPSSSMTPTLSAYLRNAALPALSRAYELHKKRTAALLKVVAPATGNTDHLGDMELARKHQKLQLRSVIGLHAVFFFFKHSLW
jgi:hypothetical protein